MKILTKKRAVQLQAQIALITGNSQSIETYKSSLAWYEAMQDKTGLVYKSGIKNCQKTLKDLKQRKQYLDRGLSFILGDLKNVSGGVKMIIADKNKTV